MRTRYNDLQDATQSARKFIKKSSSHWLRESSNKNNPCSLPRELNSFQSRPRTRNLACSSLRKKKYVIWKIRPSVYDIFFRSFSAFSLESHRILHRVLALILYMRHVDSVLSDITCLYKYKHGVLYVILSPQTLRGQCKRNGAPFKKCRGIYRHKVI